MSRPWANQSIKELEKDNGSLRTQVDQKKAKCSLFELPARDAAAEARPGDSHSSRKDHSLLITDPLPPRRKPTPHNSGPCFFLPSHPSADGQIPDFTEIYASVGREIELHETWVNEYQAAKKDFMESVYAKFEGLVSGFFRPNIKVG